MNDSIIKHEETPQLDANLLLIEIASILYQVNNLQVAQEMIFDTLSEQFDIKKAAIAIFNDMHEEFQVSAYKGFNEDFSKEFRIGNFQHINKTTIETENITHVSCPGGKISIENRDFSIDTDTERLLLLPISFHEKQIALLVTGHGNRNLLSQNDESFVLRFANLLGPVIYGFDPVQKSTNRFENIISKIIKDRVHEARLVLNPISFSIFRLVVEERLADSIILEDMVRSYQKVFHETLTPKGDLVWLTADTVFFVYSNANLFESEKQVSELKVRVQEACTQNEDVPSFSLKHASISYPQSGENATEIVNKLWLKLFEEIYLME